MEGKILFNDFLTLEKPLYFNWEELKDNGIIKATIEKPIHDLKKFIVVKKIPINLDLFNNEINSYCYENSFKLHKGLFIYPKLVFTESTLTLKNILAFILCFNYNMETNELEVSLVDFDDLDLYIDFKTQGTVKEAIFEDLGYYIENIVDNKGNLNVEVWASTFEILEHYKEMKSIEDGIANNSGVVKWVKEAFPNVEISSSTSKDLIKCLNSIFRDVRSNKLKNIKIHEMIKNKSSCRLIYSKKNNPEDLTEANLKESNQENKL